MNKQTEDRYALYGSFAVQDFSTGYSLVINDYQTASDAGDGLSAISGQSFSTLD